MITHRSANLLVKYLSIIEECYFSSICGHVFHAAYGNNRWKICYYSIKKQAVPKNQN